MLDDLEKGQTICEGRWTVVEPLTSPALRGRYRAHDALTGATALVTSGLPQTVPHAQIRDELRFAVTGIAPLAHIGPVYASSTYDVLVEIEPEGRPAVEIAVPWTKRMALDVAGDLAGVFERAHRNGTRVGGVRPEVIYLNDVDGRLRMSGIAPRFERFWETSGHFDVGLSDPFSILLYAPETIRGQKGTFSDVFSLCALVHWWITGSHPFEGDSEFDTVVAIVTGNRRVLPPEQAALLPDVVHRGLSSSPADRPTMADIAAEMATEARSSRQ